MCETVQQVCQDPVHLRWHRTVHHRGFYLFHPRMFHVHRPDSPPDGHLFRGSPSGHCFDPRPLVFGGHPLHFRIWQCLCHSRHLLFSGIRFWASGCRMDGALGWVYLPQLDCGRGQLSVCARSVPPKRYLRRTSRVPGQETGTDLSPR